MALTEQTRVLTQRHNNTTVNSESGKTTSSRQRRSATTHIRNNDENASARDNDENPEKVRSPATWSSGVVFYPPSQKYWRIGNHWYDLSSFQHPGGSQLLHLARDRFEDATFVFEAHHHNYQQARKILQKYLVPEDRLAANKTVLTCRPTRQETGRTGRNNVLPSNEPTTHHDSYLAANKHPKLLPDDAFYSVLRQRVAAYLKEVDCKEGGPSWTCINLFWAVFSLWLGAMFVTYQSGSFLAAMGTGIFGALLGAFGHNWVHQPKYKDWGWAILSLDTLGFSSEGWYREHLLQHHMYTNTPWDNHFRGTDPFLVTDPTVPRHFLQQYVTPYLLPVLLSFGTYANYMAHAACLLQGQEVWSIGKLIFPFTHYLFWSKWGSLHGLALAFVMYAVTANYYFTMALMNHNTDHTTNVPKRNKSRDWGEAQLNSSADWGVDLSFVQAGIFLWLNFHTVHHLFPKIDFCHHPAIQQIMIQTCKEFDIVYICGNPISIYKEMIHSFTTPKALMEEILVYAGGI